MRWFTTIIFLFVVQNLLADEITGYEVKKVVVTGVHFGEGLFITDDGFLLRLYGAVASHGGPMQVYDIKTNPEDPKFLGQVELPGSGQALVVSGRKAYVVCNDTTTFTEIDFSTPASPQKTSSTFLLVQGTDIDLTSDKKYAYIVHQIDSPQHRLSVVYVSSMTEVDIGEFDIPDEPTSISIVGNIAYIGFENNNTNAVRKLDVSTPTAPVDITGQITDMRSEPRSLSINGSMAYAGSYFETTGAMVMNVSSSPVIVSTIALPNPTLSTALSKDGEVLFVGMDNFYGTNDVFKMVSVKDSKKPHFVESKNINLVTNITSIGTYKDYVYLGGRHFYNSIVVLKLIRDRQDSQQNATGRQWQNRGF